MAAVLAVATTFMKKINHFAQHIIFSLIKQEPLEFLQLECGVLRET